MIKHMRRYVKHTFYIIKQCVAHTNITTCRPAEYSHAVTPSIHTLHAAVHIKCVTLARKCVRSDLQIKQNRSNVTCT